MGSMIAFVILILVAFYGACELDLPLTYFVHVQPYLYLYMKVFLLSIELCVPYEMRDIAGIE